MSGGRFDWLRVEDDADLAPLLEEAGAGALWIVKHSTRCGASAHGLLQVERFRGGGPEGRWLLVEVPRQRSVADLVARRTGVRHESPQVLLLVDGELVWHASHWQVEAGPLAEAARDAGLAAADPDAQGSGVGTRT